MIHETFTKPVAPPKEPTTTELLLQGKLQETGGGVFEVVIPKKQRVELQGITTLGILELQRAHKSTDVNMERAKIVNAMLQSGYLTWEIAYIFKGRKGYSKRQIDKDKAALLKAGLKI